jgi:hypothetical protein
LKQAGENVVYRQHQIVARAGPNGFRGIAWKGGEKCFEAEGESPEKVVAELKALVDSTYVDIAAARTGDPSVKEYALAFRAIKAKITPAQLAMLKAHYHAPERIITPLQLAEAAKYKGWQAANLHYGKLGFALHDYVPTKLLAYPDGDPMYTSVLAIDVARAGSESQWQWKLRPGVAAAMELLGLHK